MNADETITRYRKYSDVAIQNWTKGRKRKKIPPFLKQILKLATGDGRPTAQGVLDVGCGPGLDSIEFAMAGLDVTGIDAVPEFLEHAKREAKIAGVLDKSLFVLRDFRKIHYGRRPGGKRTFDLIWANASLIHLRKKQLPMVLRRLGEFLSPNGILAATFFHGKGEGVFHGSFIPGRFFARYLKAELVRAFRRGGWTVISIATVANQDRRGRWVNVVATRV